MQNIRLVLHYLIEVGFEVFLHSLNTLLVLIDNIWRSLWNLPGQQRQKFLQIFEKEEGEMRDFLAESSALYDNI